MRNCSRRAPCAWAKRMRKLLDPDAADASRLSVCLGFVATRRRYGAARRVPRSLAQLRPTIGAARRSHVDLDRRARLRCQGHVEQGDFVAASMAQCGNGVGLPPKLEPGGENRRHDQLPGNIWPSSGCSLRAAGLHEAVRQSPARRPCSGTARLHRAGGGFLNRPDPGDGFDNLVPRGRASAGLAVGHKLRPSTAAATTARSCPILTRAARFEEVLDSAKTPAILGLLDPRHATRARVASNSASASRISTNPTLGISPAEFESRHGQIPEPPRRCRLF